MVLEHLHLLLSGSHVDGVINSRQDHGGTDVPSYLTSSNVTVLKITSLTCSAISVVSALLAFYWFTRMRRSFRHE